MKDKNWMFVLFIILFFLGIQADDTCSGLGVTLSTISCYPPFPVSQYGVAVLASNNTYTCKVELGFNFSDTHPNASYSLAFAYQSPTDSQWSAYGNGYWIRALYFDTTREGSTNSSSITLYGTLSVGINFIGSFFLFSSISIHLTPQQTCYPSISWLPSSIFPPQIIVVNNNPFIADITPPLIYSIKTDKTNYNIGDTIITYAYVVDRSYIDLENANTMFSHISNSSQLSCSNSTWKNITEKERIIANLPSISSFSSFSSSSSLSSISPHPLNTPPHIPSPPPNTDGWYSSECLITNNIELGGFYLNWIKIFDIYGNGFVNAPYWSSTVTFTVSE